MDELRLKGFKCFVDSTLNLNQVTILTGNNGSGKSSVIQALLLLREAVERCVRRVDVRNTWEWSENVLQLNNYRKLQLGGYDDICHVAADDISIGINGVDFQVEEDEEHAGCICMRVDAKALDTLPAYLTQKEFYYLNAERIGPRVQSEMLHTDYPQSGDCGELAGNVLLDASKAFPKVEKERLFEEEGSLNFNIQVDKWMSYIFSEVSVKSEPITAQVCRIRLRGSRVITTTPNTGFGYTYALPIVIDGLIAKRGSLLIVENPEAHLHPRAQSNIGYFLGKMGAAGLKIVIETHSEHVVNGIRRASLSNWGLNPEDVSIYFFQNVQEGCCYLPITIDTNGNLSDFPVDFFDQVRQDMLAIIRLATKRKKE